MNAIKTARKLIETDPTSDAARTLSRLVLALESETGFELADIYELDLPAFELAIQILSQWRLDRYYAGKAKLFDLSYQLNSLPPSA
ncbi:hypothetical protein [Variovorax sp.]|uniref:hypothetical protein n=1 Tax=Variovorax sp. TaxID=1871043 RepID=UPI0037DA40F4